jgi:lactate dehydrogenase-like 2-hydroxyacid dehydrogenase
MSKIIPPVLIASPVSPMIIDRVARKFKVMKLYECADEETYLQDHAHETHAAIIGYNQPFFNASNIKRFPNLEIISSFGVGYDHVDVQAARKHNIIVTNTPDVLTDEVADLAMGLLISTLRCIPQADQYVRDGSWLSKGAFPLSDTIQGKTMGIVGFGRIGKAIAKRARAFGVKLVYHGRSQQDGVRLKYYPNLVEMAQAVDILMVITPGGASTHHLINQPVLEALGSKGTLINVARGSVVDEAALISALASGKLGAAGLDVFELEPCAPKELIAMPNVVLLPHIASASHHTRNLMGKLVADNIISWLSGKGAKTPVFETPQAHV